MFGNEVVERYPNYSYNRLVSNPFIRSYNYSIVPNFNDQLSINGYSLWRIIQSNSKHLEDVNADICVGWKFHVGIHSNYLREDLEKTWNIVKDEMIHNRIIQTKILLLKTLQADVSARNRAITIYAFKEFDNKNWFPIIISIEETLARVGVHPLQETAGACTFLPNCRYIQYRCDKRPGYPEQQYRNPRFKRYVYVGEEDAIKDSKVSGNQSHNPFSLSMPLFLERLIAQLNEKNYQERYRCVNK
jgi:hypothetical protein